RRFPARTLVGERGVAMAILIGFQEPRDELHRRDLPLRRAATRHDRATVPRSPAARRVRAMLVAPARERRLVLRGDGRAARSPARAACQLPPSSAVEGLPTWFRRPRNPSTD